MALTELALKIASYLPEVKRPEGEVPLKKRILWSALALIVFFVMGNITLIGITGATDQLAVIQEVLGSEMGTLLTTGIGPIVFASLMLQLLVGAKLIDINVADPKGRSAFQSLQKVTAIAFCFFQGFMYPLGGLVEGNVLLLGLQIAAGSIILYYLDDLIGKYGIGSGIGLFIAGGVTYRIFWQLFRVPAGAITEPGIIHTFIQTMATGAPNFLLLLPILIALLIFLAVTYAQGMHVNIPITLGRKGLGGRYPVRLLYVSVIPVIFASAIFAQFSLFAAFTRDVPMAGDGMRYLTWATGNPVTEGLMPTAGAGQWARYNTTTWGLFEDVIVRVGADGWSVLLQEVLFLRLIQAFLYLILFTIACVIFGKLWVMMGGQSPEDIAEQLESSGMHIPGFRRDKRVTVKILNRYIPTITILGSVFVAFLAAFGNMSLGTLTSGTGILLTVGIIYNIYEQLARYKARDMHPLFKKLLG